MAQTLGIRKVGRGGRYFVDQARLRIDADMFFMPAGILLLAFAANPDLLIHRQLREHVIVQLLDLGSDPTKGRKVA